MDNQRPVVMIDGTPCHVNIGSYPASRMAMYMQIDTADTQEPYMRATVNLGNYSGNMSFVQFGSTFLDTNNCSKEDLDSLCDALGGEPYTRFGEPVTMGSGFVDYPLYQFNLEKLKEYDPQGFERYDKDWHEECVHEQRVMNAALFGDFEDDDFEDEDDDEYDAF